MSNAARPARAERPQNRRHRPSAAAKARTRGSFRPNAAGFAPAGGETPARWPKKVAARPQKSPQNPPKIPQRPPKTPGKGQPRGKNAPRQRVRLWQCRLPRTKSRPPSPGPDGPKRHPISFDHPRRNGRTNAPKRKRMKHFSFSFGKKEKNSFRKPPVSVYFIQHIC